MIIHAYAIHGFGERKKNRGGKNMKDKDSRPSTSHNSGYAVPLRFTQIALRYASGNFA